MVSYIFCSCCLIAVILLSEDTSPSTIWLPQNGIIHFEKAGNPEIFSFIKHSCGINPSFVSSRIKGLIMHLLLDEYAQLPVSHNLVPG